MDADIFISLSHFKGHEATGFGGALKNIGMGCGSRAGKMQQHASGKPSVREKLCRGCGRCAKECGSDAITYVNKKAVIDYDKCKGCGRCIGACSFDAIYNPIGCESIDKIIKPGDTVAFICNDPTRVANSFDFMPVLVNEMNRLGVPDENMKIVFALGTHREMSHEEMVEQVGEEVASRLRMFNSIATKSEDFEYFGDTSRGTPVWIHKELCNVDHVILTGTIVHHYFSGYGGGRKAVLPGCAAMETVTE